MDDYITKPIDTMKLYAVIEEHLLPHVLISDERREHRHYLGSLFAQYGWHTVLAENTSQSLWECEHSNFDLIFIDLNSGLQIESILQKIKNRVSENMPLIVGTTLHENKDMQAYYSKMGIVTILHKPIDKEQLSHFLSTTEILPKTQADTTNQ